MSNTALEEIIEEGSKSLSPDERQQLQGVLDSEEVRKGVTHLLLALGLIYLLEKEMFWRPRNESGFTTC